MAYFSWIEQRDNLSPIALTIRAQTISPNDTGALLWDAFFPTADADSTVLSDIVTTDWRPTADRREWNTPGRHIPVKTPDLARIEMIPIESYFKIQEQEINKLLTQVRGNQGMFQEAIAVRIPARTDMLAQANYRRIEVDAFTAWALGQVTVKNPQIGGTTTVSFGYDAARYLTAGVAWNGAVNAYDEFLAFMRSAEDLIGPTAGAVMRLATMLEIQKDAPNPIPGTTGIRMTRAQMEDRIAQDLGRPFRFYILEHTVDIFNDGGNDVTRTKVWPAQRVAAVPQGERVGTTHRAPVARAYDLANAAGDDSIDIRGMTVFNDIGGVGRELTVECQGNYFTVPNEQRVAVINAGV